jgi:hypothetical protein
MQPYLHELFYVVKNLFFDFEFVGFPQFEKSKNAIKKTKILEKSQIFNKYFFQKTAILPGRK